MKTYTGIELLQAIKKGEIKSGTNIEVHDLSVLDRLVTIIHINSDRGLVWKTGEFDTSFLLNDYYYFRVKKQDIDIQNIKELDICNFGHNNTISQQEVWYIEKVNELIKAIKQLDRQINNN